MSNPTPTSGADSSSATGNGVTGNGVTGNGATGIGAADGDTGRSTTEAGAAPQAGDAPSPAASPDAARKPIGVRALMTAARTPATHHDAAPADRTVSSPPQPTAATHQPTAQAAGRGRHVPVAQGMYDAVGGHAFFQRLVDEFYRGVADDEPLRAMYPEQDLGPAADRLRMFLEQYWGGPHTYHEQRGHPRLRMRHAPFAVTPTQRDRWLAHMRHALDQQHLEPALDAEMWAYLAGAAQFLVNTPE